MAGNPHNYPSSILVARQAAFAACAGQLCSTGPCFMIVPHAHLHFDITPPRKRAGANGVTGASGI
jgi:hypothetical protein